MRMNAEKIELYAAFTAKFLNFQMPNKLCCNQPEFQANRPNHSLICGKIANGMSNSEDPDQTAPLLL